MNHLQQHNENNHEKSATNFAKIYTLSSTIIVYGRPHFSGIIGIEPLIPRRKQIKGISKVTTKDVSNSNPFADELTFWIHFCNHYLDKYEKLPDSRGLLALYNAAAAYIYQEKNL